MTEEVNDTAAKSPFGEFALERPPAPDRLPPMLFLAALLHGILIIGVTFNVVLDDAFEDAISLEVTIVADPDRYSPDVDSAKYLAQASQEGDGNTEEAVRASAPTQSAMPIDNPGLEEGDALQDAHNTDTSADQLLATSVDQDERVSDDPREDPTQETATAIALEAGEVTTLPLPQDRDATLAVQDDNPRRLVTSVNTKDSVIAPYVDNWKRKVEKIGVELLPELGVGDDVSGSPTLQVTIAASGQLLEAIIRKSSGSKILDQAAVDILRRASPYDPFSEAIRADHDELVFIYKWEFSQVEVPARLSAL